MTRADVRPPAEAPCGRVLRRDDAAYDAPDPRASESALGVVGVALVLAVAAFVIYRFADTGQFDAAEVGSGSSTRTSSCCSPRPAQHAAARSRSRPVLALAFGAVFAAGRLSDHRWLRGPATVVVEFFRAIPLLVMIFSCTSACPAGSGSTSRRSPRWCSA